MAVLSCGSDEILKNEFYMPFQETANYLNMKYATDVHGWIENNQISKEVSKKLDTFIHKLNT